MKTYAILSFFTIIILSACSDGGNKIEEMSLEEREHASYDNSLADKIGSLKPIPLKADNPDNPTTDAKIKLGHVLYFDTRLSMEGNNSCNSCHNLDTYGVDRLPTSPGDKGMNGDRNSPTTLNAALHTSQFWDGRAADVEEQAGGPVLNPVEMAIPSEEFMMNRLKNIELYKKLFAEAYPDQANPFTYTNMRNAIGVFERQLLTPSPVDQYLRGDESALTLEEKKGMLLFVNIGCATCHNGPAFGGDQIQKFGVYKDYWEATGSEHIDKGLAQQTGDEELDLYKFKVPSLRNVAETYPYFHDGSVKDLEETVRIMADVQLNYQLRPDQVKHIVAFLNALTGEVPAQYKNKPAELKQLAEQSEEVAVVD